jgi:hypothetical protein
VTEDEIGDGSDFALGIGAADEEDGGGLHLSQRVYQRLFG